MRRSRPKRRFAGSAGNRLWFALAAAVTVVAVGASVAAAATTFVTSWGSEGSSHGEFLRPHGVAVDAYGNVYVADTGNDRIEKFRQW